MTLPLSRRCSRRTIVQGFAAAAAAGPLVPGICYADAEGAVVRSGGAEIEVTIATQNFDLPGQAIVDWVARCAGAVTAWLGGFPLKSARVRIEPADVDRGVRHGTSWGDRGALCRVSLGTHTTKGDLDRDWVLTHELFHFAFPSVPERHRWIEEGLSPSAYPFGGWAVGLREPDRFWNEMIRDMPQGLSAGG